MFIECSREYSVLQDPHAIFVSCGAVRGVHSGTACVGPCGTHRSVVTGCSVHHARCEEPDSAADNCDTFGMGPRECAASWL